MHESPRESQPEPLHSLYQELKRRSVLRVAGVYIVAAWVAIQASDILYQPLGFAHSPVRAIMVIALIGFPFAIAGAWFFNVTRDRDAAAQHLSTTQSRLALAAFVVIGGAALLFGGWIALRPAGSAREPDAKPDFEQPDHVAVLYFRDLSPTSTPDDYLANAITETLIDQLAAQDSISVISSNGVRPFEGRAPSVDSIARFLNVGTLVSGRVTRATDKILVDLEVMSPDGRIIETKHLTRPRGEAVQLVDDVVREASDFVRERIGNDLTMQRWQRGTKSDSAWIKLRQSHALDKHARYDVEPKAGPAAALAVLIDADSLAAQAERIDPDYADATIWRAWLAYGRAFYAFHPLVHDVAAGRASFDEGYAHVARELVRHPDDPQALEARGALGVLKLTLLSPTGAERTQIMNAAEADLRTAARKDPGRARATSNLSQLLATKGDYEGAAAFANQAYKADAYLEDRNILARLFSTSFELGRDDDAAKWCAEMERRDAASIPSAFCRLELMGWAADVKPSIDSAWAVMKRPAPSPYTTYMQPHLQMLVATVIARAGKPDSARAILDRMHSAKDASGDLFLQEAAARAALKDAKTATALLAQYESLHPEEKPLLEKSRRFALLRSAAQ